VKGAESEFKDTGLKVIWIGFQDKEEKIKEFALKNGIKDNLAYDKGDKVAKQYGIKYGAGLAIINSSGICVERLPKGFSAKRLSDALRKALGN